MKNVKKIALLLLSLFLIFTTLQPISTKAASNKITDIKTTNGFYTAAKWAVDNGYLSLYTGGKFDPNRQVTEQEVMQMIAKVDKNYHLKNTYDGATVYKYYGDKNFPLNGVNNTSMRSSKVTRGHFARIYAAMNGMDLSQAQAIQYMYLNEITKGTTGSKTFEDFKPGRNLTRGELAAFMYRINQLEGIKIEGIVGKFSGKDNGKITLPANFYESSNGTVTVTPKPGTSTDDKEERPSVYKAVESIDVEKEKLTANGVDSSLITIKLKDSYGNAIPYSESLAFKITSEAGATFSATNSSTSNSASVIYSDGPELSVYVTAPTLTKSTVDKIYFELVNNTDSKYYTYKNQVIEASLRYVVEPELRISYQVYDPDQPDWSGGDVDSGVKPLPALPVGIVSGNMVPYTTNGTITISEYDEDLKLMSGYKWESFTHPTTGVLTQDNVYSDKIQYGNAELKLEGQTISVWLFEQILNYMIEGNPNDTSWGGVGYARVMYTVNSDGRATYDLQGVMSEEHTAQFESTLHATIIYLINFLPKADGITLAHAESVEAIKAIYDKLSLIDQNMLQKNFSQAIGKLEGAKSKIEILKKGQELAQRPEGLDRYTKVIVNVIAPGGTVITDYRGTVEVTFNGVTRKVSFDTNTTDYNAGTGNAGSAVVFFDDIVYGQSEVTAKLVDKDSRYDKLLESLNGVTVKKSIYTNPKFEQNSCSTISEVAFIVDHSASMQKNDPNNDISKKLKQVIKQLGQKQNHVYHVNSKGYLEKTGTAKEVSDISSLLEYKHESSATNLADAIETAINKFTSTQQTQKAIVLVTDGKTDQSKIERVTKLAKDKNIKVYVLSLGKYSSVQESWLQTIASETGGAYLNAETTTKLHGPFQSIINSILCNKVVVDSSCLIADTLFNQTSVSISRTVVTMNARTATSCENVSKISVTFTSVNGSVTYDLQKRNASVYRLVKSVSEFQPFNLYSSVEFKAYDKSNNMITSKVVDIQ